MLPDGLYYQKAVIYTIHKCVLKKHGVHILFIMFWKLFLQLSYIARQQLAECVS